MGSALPPSDRSSNSSGNAKSAKEQASALDVSYNMNRFGETVSFHDGDGSDTGAQRADESGDRSAILGTTVGRYQIQSILGEGGFGAVYRAYDDQLDRPVAIKVPLLDENAAEAQSEFLREARQLARLAHPGIVSVHDVGVDQGRCFIVTEFLEGKNLNQWLKVNQPTWEQSTGIIAGIADALAHAHATSTVHRDVKPANIIMVKRPEGLRPVLVDFGLAVSDTVSEQARRGVVSGTPNYMAPEQAQGEGHRIDGRTDIYALGVILYRMLCGQLPFRSRKLSELLDQVINDTPQPPRQISPQLPRELEQVCLKALSKTIDERQTTAADMAEELRALVGSKIEAVDVTLPGIATVDAPSAELPSTEMPSSMRRSREAERRHVTMLACSSEFFESEDFIELDPEDQHDLQSDYRQTCTQAVTEFGGAVEQFTSQGMLACFGFPVAYEDSAQRAVRSGIHLQESLLELGKKRKVAFAPQCAVHTGAVVAEQASDLSRTDTAALSIAGAGKNVTVRLGEQADPDTLVISSDTRQLVRAFFQCESQGTQKVRGASEPIEVFLVTGESEARHRLDLLEPKDLTPLIGRATELSILRDRWEQAAEGMGQVVLLIGDAGLGKSRLIREIREHVSQTDPEAELIELRCSSYHQNSGLYPAIEFFERLLGFQRDTAAAQKLDALIAHLDDYGLDLQSSVPLFAAMQSIPLDDRYSPFDNPLKVKEMTQQTLLDWLRQFASRQPVLFIVEDLHWVDPSTLEWLALLIEDGFQESILSVLTFRPEFKTPWTSAAHQTQVALNRLTKRQVGQMMREHTGMANLSTELIEQIVERTDGVPLFVEEFTRVIQEADELQDVDGSVQLSGSLHLASIPSSLHDLLTSRLDRMDCLHDVVQLGATLGREFSYELMSAVSEIDDETLQAELEKLVKAEVLFQKGRPPQCSFIFKHALIQDAAYDSLLKKKRQKFHDRIATKLQSDFAEIADAQPELVANHLTEAGQAQSAAMFWFKAGERSFAQCANAEALTQLGKGLEQLAETDESPERNGLELGLQLKLSATLMAAKGYSAPEVEGVLKRARELCEQIGEGAPLFPVLWGMWGWRLIREEMDICRKLADESMALAQASRDDGMLCEAYFVTCLTNYYVGEFTLAGEHCEKSVELADLERTQFYVQFTGHNSTVVMWAYVAMSKWVLGYPDQSLQAIPHSDQLAQQLDHPFTTVVGLYLTGYAYAQARDGEQAEPRARKVIELAQEYGFLFYVGFGKCLLGGALVEQGKYPQAIIELREGIEITLMTGAQVKLPCFQGWLAEALWKTGELTEARKQLKNAFERMNDHNCHWNESTLLRLKAEFVVDESLDNAAEAETLYREAIAIAQSQQAKSFELRVMLSLSRLLIATGRSSEAQAQLQPLHDEFTEGFESVDLTTARQLLVECAQG